MIKNKKKNMLFRKSGQEEMVGFAVIMVVVAVIILILLGFMFGNSSNKESTQDYQIESFIQAILQYTSSCGNQLQFLSVQDLISACNEGDKCLDGTNSCSILNDTVKNIMGSSWNVGNQSSVKGYNLDITTDKKDELSIRGGNTTISYRGAFQDFAKGGKDYRFSLKIYS